MYRIIFPNGKKSPHLFFCPAVFKSEEYTFPVFHIVSAKLEAQRIAHFFAEIKKRVKSPGTVISDFSKAILIAAAKVFAECVDIQDYLKRCYQIQMSIGYPETPDCFIRLDISYLVKMICRWPCIKN